MKAYRTLPSLRPLQWGETIRKVGDETSYAFDHVDDKGVIYALPQGNASLMEKLRAEDLIAVRVEE